MIEELSEKRNLECACEFEIGPPAPVFPLTRRTPPLEIEPAKIFERYVAAVAAANSAPQANF
jgi:hypothetical protein